MARRTWTPSSALLLGLVLATLLSSGCIGVANWLAWGLWGQKVPAEFGKFKEKRVAVICATPSTPFDPGGTTGAIARGVGTILAREVKKIDLVDVEEVADWIDRNDWMQMDYREVGKGVKADYVVAIDFESLSFQDNATMVRGRADFSVSVYDMAAKERVFFREVREHTFPTHGPASMSIRKFEPLYLDRLSRDIAQYFYDHDFTENFGNDALVH